MKIIYYSPHPTHDIVSEVGYATHQREVINALKNLGHELIPVIMGGTEASNLNPVTNQNYKPSILKRVLKKFIPKILWTSFNNMKLLKHDEKARHILEKTILLHGADLLYERSEYLQNSGAICAKKFKIKYFLEVNAPFVEEMKSFEGPSLLERKAHQIEKFKLDAADKVIAVSSSLSAFLVEKYKCQKEKIFVQANCINPDKIKIENELLTQIKAHFNPRNKKVIGFVGSMFPYHGVDRLIQAFAELIKSNNNCLLMIVGDGKIINNLKAMCQSLSIEKEVVFTGKINHNLVFNYIEMMDICVMAKSNWYGSPVKIFEYGLMKKPIIAPNVSPVTDVIENNVDAIIIDESQASLVNAMDKLLKDEVFAKQLAHQFHNKVLNAYTWQHAALNIIRLCE